jgi:DNA (cytosine-5)-methyltransferase 1
VSGRGEGWIANQPGVQPCEHLYLGDTRGLACRRILGDLGLAADEIGCVFGGPPCQGFSRAGKREPDDPRNELVFEFMRVLGVSDVSAVEMCRRRHARSRSRDARPSA